MEAIMWNSKPKKASHKCRKRQHGNPKVGEGICFLSGTLREAVVERIKGKRLEKAWIKALRGGIDPDDFDE
jgi:hypothetical protein